MLEGAGYMKWAFAATFFVEHPEDAGIESHLDAAMEELITLGADPDITALLAKGIIEIEVTIEATNASGAVNEGLAVMRTALHASGANTADWPESDDVVQDVERGHWAVRLAGVEARTPELIDA